ncbi:MAG: hypothetical protein V3R54_00830 [Thermodesulfovibrionia bacterium]
MAKINKVLISAGKIILMGLFLIFLSSQQVLAQDDEIKALEEKMQILMEEVDALKEKQPEGNEKKLHFHGYGELHYNNTGEEGKNDKMDFHRMVIGWTYHFNDWIVLDAEVDFEHAATEMELEYAHISFLFSDAFNIRMGSMLMPVGYLNEFHEPTLFYSVERPYVQNNVIPTTWQEGGVGIFGSPHPDLNYRLYLVGGLDASKFKASSGIRKGRGKVASAKGDNLAVVGRIEYGGIPGLNLGISGYLGDAAQGDSALGDATVSILEGDIRYRWKDLELTGLVVSVNVDDTDKINTKTGQVIGEEILGWYAEGAYHLGKSFLPENQDLVLFVRHEQFNTQKKVAASLTADPANDRKVTTFGLTYFPIPQVAVKADLESWENGAGTDWHQSNLGVAYMF